MKTLYKSIILIIGCLFASSFSFAHFGSKGPFGGSVSCSIVKDTTVYIGTTAGGVFESTNTKLVAWRARPVGLKSGKITALAHSGSYLFCGTADSGVYIFNGYVGADRYWNKINTGLTNLQITSLTAIDSITIMAGTAGGGIFKTTNKGASWTAVNTPILTDLDITGLVKAGNRIIHISGGGVFASDNNGASWMNYNDTNTVNEHTHAISYNATTNQIMIYNHNGLYVLDSASNDIIQAYALAVSGLPANTDVRSISNNGTTWFIATDNGVFTSPTGTIAWTAQNTNLTSMDVTTVAPIQTNLVLGTASEGIYKSPAATIAWVAYNGSFNNLVTYSMHTGGTSLAIAATEKGVFVCKNVLAGTAVYVRSNTGLTDSLNVTDLTMGGAMLYATTKNNGVFMSADTGKTWTAMNTGLTHMNIKKIFTFATDLYMFDSNGNVFQYIASNWMPIQTGLPSGVVPTSMASYTTTIFLSTYGHGVYTRGGSSISWTAANTGLSNLNVTSITANANKLFAGTDGSGVMISDPTAINWAATSTTTIAHTTLMNLNASKIQAMAFFNGYVFASYKGGLVATSDNGTTWIQGGNQFNLPSYTNVNKISFVATRVFVTTENNCLYSNALNELPSLTSVEEATLTNALNVYPNPSNGNFTISLNDNTTNIYDVVIYDAMGRLMEHIVNDGTQSTLNINADYATGIYFVQVQTNKGVVTQKIMVK